MDDQQLSELIEGSVQDLNFRLSIQTDKKMDLIFSDISYQNCQQIRQNWPIKNLKKDLENHILVALLIIFVGEGKKKLRCIFCKPEIQIWNQI